MGFFDADRRNLLTNLVLVCPLFVIYQLGVLFTLPLLNGADFVTILLLHHLHLSTLAYLGFVLGVAATLVLAVVLLGKKQKFDRRVVLPVFLESTVYALTMGSLIIFLMNKVLGFSPKLSGSGTSIDHSILTSFVMSIGAGLYEETVFRLGLLTISIVVAEKLLGFRRWVAVIAGLAFSSLAFSAMHHIPPYGELFTLQAFTYRTLAGVFFSLLFWYRGFAVAVYSHAFYDMYVMIVLAR
jgi:membrane protease YdiL (CAAX protease family)